MSRWTALGLIAALASVAAAWHAAPEAPAPGQVLAWPELLPPGWQPAASPAELATLRDDSPEGRAAWASMQSAFASAPLRQSLDGMQIRLSGYVVPLDAQLGGLTELLLVPYDGACIHSPPPPANQIVWVKLREPVRGLGSFDTVEVAGRLTVSRQQTALATAGYEMRDATLKISATSRTLRRDREAPIAH